MKPTAILKIIVDIAMTILLMLLMAFELVGRSAHEWIGLGMFLLFILHHVLNRRWSRNLFLGWYTPARILQTACAALVLLSMLGSLISAVPISRVVFSFLPISGGLSFGRTLHMLSAYWGFVLLSFHLGLHWNMLLAMIKKSMPVTDNGRTLFGGHAQVSSACRRNRHCPLRRLRLLQTDDSRLPVPSEPLRFL